MNDPEQHLISGAEIEVIGDLTNLRYTSETNGSGFYSLPSLPPGTYHVQVSKGGFKTVVKSELTLYVQSAVALNFNLPVGAASETVTVEASGIQVNTLDATVSTVVDRNFVQNMPLNGRSFQTLLTLAPGVSQVPTYNASTSNGAGMSGEIVVNGQRSEANQYTIDGVSANVGTQPASLGGQSAGPAGNTPGVTSFGSTQSLISIDALQEFRSSTSSYAAEFGRTPGGNFAFSTRSGTNTLHGSAYDYFRNDALDANNWFNNFYGYPKGREHQNDFGGTLGGPIIFPYVYDGRSRSFFFFSYEGLRLQTPQATAQYPVPTDALRSQAPLAIQPLLKAFPVANYGVSAAINGFAYYLESVSFPSTIDSTSVRFDHVFGSRITGFLRYANSPSNHATYTGAVQSSLGFTNQSVTAGLTFSPTTHQSNELRFNWTQTGGVQAAESTALGGATPFDLTAIPQPNGRSFASAGSLFSASFTYAANVAFTLSQRTTAQRVLNVTDAHNWSLGHHSFKAGIDWRQINSTLNPQNPNEQFTYATEAQVLSNQAGSAQAKADALQAAKPSYLNFSAFAQDEWKISSRLSASLGVRWDVNPAPRDRGGYDPYTTNEVEDFQSVTLMPRGTPLWKTDWHGFAPRLGLAYLLNPGASHLTVVRAGFGLFYDTGNSAGSSGYGQIGYASSVKYTNATFPLTSAQLLLPAPSVAAPYRTTVVGFNPNLKLPYSIQYNLAVERKLTSHDSLTLNYVGAGGRKLLTTFYVTPATEGNTNFASGIVFQSIDQRASSGYNSLQTKFQRDLSHGLQVLTSYTWAHSIDNASNNFGLYQLTRASSDFDVRHNVQAAVTYQLATAHASHWLVRRTNGFGIDLRVQAFTGEPVNLIGSQQYDITTGVYYDYQPNFVSGVSSYLYGGDYPGHRILNYAGFSIAPAGTNGNVPRNWAKGFGAGQLDTAVRRDIALTDSLHLQFRAEAFNLFNHPMFGAVYNSLAYGQSLFGRPFNTLNGALGGGLNSLYQTGGPRSLQLTLHLSY